MRKFGIVIVAVILVIIIGTVVYKSQLTSSTSQSTSAPPLSTTPAEREYPPTTMITMQPWEDYDAAATETYISSSTDDFCRPSALANRNDAYRCFLKEGASDPCFVGPTSDKPLLCTQRKNALKVESVRLEPREEDEQAPPLGEGPVYEVVLHDGTVCVATEGAGPPPAEDYPGWFGNCQGQTAGIWRARETNHNPTLRLYDPTPNGTYFAAISTGSPESAPTLHPVKLAYR